MNKLLPPLTIFLVCSLLQACSGDRPTDLGIQETGAPLKQCPESPNCVVSFYQEKDPDHYLEPIKIESPAKKAYENILSLLKKLPRVKIFKKEENYIRTEFTSAVFGFVDDVEFYFAEEGKIHFRSASRIGHSDLGVNKDRIEKIRFKYHQRDF